MQDVPHIFFTDPVGFNVNSFFDIQQVALLRRGHIFPEGFKYFLKKPKLLVEIVTKCP